MTEKRRWCGGAGIYAGTNKPGRRGQTIPCPRCKKLVKLTRAPNGDINWYVMVPRHKVTVCYLTNDQA